MAFSHQIARSHLMWPAIAFMMFTLGQLKARGQDSLIDISEHTLKKMGHQLASTRQKLDKSAETARRKIDKSQQQLYGQLAKIDSALAIEWLGDCRAISDKCRRMAQPGNATGSGPYLPRLDSLQTLLRFLAPREGHSISVALDGSRALQGRMNDLQLMEQLLDGRQHALRESLGQFTPLPKGLLPGMRQYQTRLEGYKAEIAAWKQKLSDPQKMEKEVLALLNQLPAFQQFMRENSQLSAIFGAPAAGVAGQNLGGMQTLQSVNQMLQQRFGGASAGGSGSGTAFVQQQVQDGVGRLNALRSQANGLLAQLGGGEAGNASLSPYEQEKANLRIKPFLQHFEFGWNLQSLTRISNFPGISDVGLSVGYKISPRCMAGVGLAYKFAIGNWQKPALTHEGIGLRTYADWKFSVRESSRLLRNFWLTGGMEWNYFERFSHISTLETVAWQQSGLLGITKKVDLRKKQFKFQVLYDLLRKKTNAGEVPVVVRWGWSL